MNTATQQLECEIIDIASRISKATFDLLVKIRQFDESRGWAEHGFTSCTAWLNRHIGMDPRTCREKLSVAHALASLPETSSAFQLGELSYSKVRALTRVATSETESKLIREAKKVSASAFEDSLRNPNPERSKRRFALFVDKEGMVVLHARMMPEEAAVVEKAIEAVTTIPAQGEHVDRIDGLVEVAERSLSGAAVPNEASRTDDRYQVVLHIEEERAHIAGVEVSPESADRIMCDASEVRMVHDKEGNIIDTGRKTRKISPALNRALLARDRRCTFPDCTHKHVDAHHIVDWVLGGPTTLSNLTLLCRFHHRMIHEGKFQILGAGGAVRFERL